MITLLEKQIQYCKIILIIPNAKWKNISAYILLDIRRIGKDFNYMFLCEKVADFHCCEYELYSGM
jgi:hypothetical protein